MKSIRIVTRTSELALWQAHYIQQAICAYHPYTQVELIGVKTQGDKILDVSLSKIGGKGLFVKELEDKLLNRTADLAVHSLKDMPYELPEGLMLVGVTEREDPRDVFISPNYSSLALLPSGARVGTSSLRRQAQLLKIRPDLKPELLRGNVPTRINKCIEGQFDAIILAAAGVKRLGLGDHIQEYLNIEDFLPAVGQGVLGLECHQDNTALLKLLNPITHLATTLTSLAERSFNRALKGGCQVPIAGYATVEFLPSDLNLADEQSFLLKLTGRVLTPDGQTCLESSESIQDTIDLSLGLDFNLPSVIQLGKSVAEELIAQGADKIISACYAQVKS